jgi:hypothetical protein
MRPDEHETPTPLGVSSGSGKCSRGPLRQRMIYYGEDGLRGGFDWFQRLHLWFPAIAISSGAWP